MDNRYLAESDEHPQDIILKELNKSVSKMKLSGILSLWLQDREVQFSFDENALLKAEQLDGCYTFITDLPPGVLKSQRVFDRYMDLAIIKRSFRGFKKEIEIYQLYLRPKAEVFISMLQRWEMNTMQNWFCF